MRAGGDPRDDSNTVEVGVGGVSGDDSGLFNGGDGRGVRGEGGHNSGSGISIDTAADRVVDSIFCTMGVAVRSLVTCHVLHVDTGSPEDSVVQREASLLTDRWFVVTVRRYF